MELLFRPGYRTAQLYGQFDTLVFHFHHMRHVHHFHLGIDSLNSVGYVQNAQVVLA